MMRPALVFALAFVAVNAVLRNSGSAFLGSDDEERMRPDLVAKTLAKVEDEWKTQADVFTECKSADCKKTPESFASSCATVVSAVAHASGGDRDVVREYMTNVCGQKVLEGWRKLRCMDFATAIVDRGMRADKYANRNSLQPSKVCTGFWPTFVDMEQKREAEEAKVRAEQEKKRAEEEKKAAEAAAEAKKKAKAEALAEAKRRAEAEAAREKEEKEQEAKRQAAEAKARAAEAAARLAQKKAEAEEVQKAAQKKLEEAAAAEKEHQALQAEHEKAEELLRNATKASPAKVEAAVATPAEPVKLAAKSTPVKVAEPAKAAPVKVAEPASKTQTAPVVAKPQKAAAVAAAPAKKPAFLEQDPCAGCDTALAQ